MYGLSGEQTSCRARRTGKGRGWVKGGIAMTSQQGVLFPLGSSRPRVPRGWKGHLLDRLLFQLPFSATPDAIRSWPEPPKASIGGAGGVTRVCWAGSGP